VTSGLGNSGGAGVGGQPGQPGGSAGNNNLSDFGSRININPLSPPNMRTLVYSPDVRVLIGHGSREIDVSKDIVRVQMIRKENSVSTVFITLANKGARYNGKFDPMDRITVYMKRINWVQAFSGYLDTVPFRQLYQGAITIKASCTLKRLLHTWWNPGLAESAKIFNQMGIAAATAGDGVAGVRDSGLGSLLRELLIRVGGWNLSNIHIQNFPVLFFEFLKTQVQTNQAANQAQVDKFKRLLLGDDITGGSGIWANHNPAAGAPGPIVVAGQAGYVAEIVAACDEAGLGPTTLNLQTAQGLQQAAAQGATGTTAAIDPQQNSAWEGVGETALNIQTTTRNADGAILGVACALGESGLRNLANAALPDSLRFPNDGVGADHDSVGLFQQRNFAEWGTLSERMNPRQSARMFFQHLARTDWRNADPGQAIFTVQRGGSPAYFSGFITQAKQLVQEYRAAQEGASTTVTSAPVVNAVSSAAAAAGVPIKTAPNVITTTPETPDGARQHLLGKPNPDSEGAVMTAMEQIGKPYVWGARGPTSYDCSGLFDFSFRSIGLDIGGWTGAQVGNGTAVAPSAIRRGDLIFTGSQGSAPGHVAMWMGDGTILESPQPGSVVNIRPITPDYISGAVAIRRYADNGGADPTAPRGFPPAMGPGMSPGVGQAAGVGGGTGGTHSEPIARNLFSYIFQPDQFVNPVADLWSAAGNHKDFIDSQPLIQMVQAVSRSSLRNFASAPNGDFIAYYPDYFGLDGKPATLRLEDIELKDVHIDFSDDNLTTHVYVAGDYTMMGLSNQVLAWLDTAGVASVEHEWLFQRLRQVGLGDYGAISGQDLMRRFGVRPLQTTYTMAGSHELEFLLACQIFMEKWAQQYQTQVSFTFMPELFPGMRVLLGDHNVQVYVSEVTHSCDFTNGFTTTATIMAPSNPGAKNQMTQVQSTARPDATEPIVNEFLS